MVLKAVFVAFVVKGCGSDSILAHVLIAVYVDLLFFSLTEIALEVQMGSLKGMFGEGISRGWVWTDPNHVILEAIAKGTVRHRRDRGFDSLPPRQN